MSNFTHSEPYIYSKDKKATKKVVYQIFTIAKAVI